MLKTGIVPAAASSSSSASGPVRTPTASTWRERTSAVSRTDSPRESCISSGRRIIGWPPSSTMPASKDTRVRVEAFWKTSATIRSRSASDERGAAFSSPARASSGEQLIGAQLGAGEEMARQGGEDTERCWS